MKHRNGLDSTEEALDGQGGTVKAFRKNLWHFSFRPGDPACRTVTANARFTPRPAPGRYFLLTTLG